MISLTVNTIGHEIGKDIESLDLSPAKRRRLLVQSGKDVANVLRGHFRKLDQRGNKRGWPSQHFWGNRIRNATAFVGATEETALVTVADRAYLAKLHGGTIKPVEKKALAIPLRPEAYGARASSIDNLFVLRLFGKAYLARREEAATATRNRSGRQESFRPRAKGALTLLYALKASVTVPADPDAYPEEQIRQAISDRVARIVAEREPS
jgi:hypothetical protein